MRKSEWTEALIVGMLREHDLGRNVAEIRREHGDMQLGLRVAAIPVPEPGLLHLGQLVRVDTGDGPR